MRGLVRILMMFAPMIIRQMQRRGRRGGFQQQRRQPERQPQHLPEQKRGDYVKYEEAKPKYLEPDDPNEKLTDKDIMLNEKDLRHFENGKKQSDLDNADVSEIIPDEALDLNQEKKQVHKENDIDLKDLFLD